jgi:hypothetical protein
VRDDLDITCAKFISEDGFGYVYGMRVIDPKAHILLAMERRNGDLFGDLAEQVIEIFKDMAECIESRLPFKIHRGPVYAAVLKMLHNV